MRSRIETQDALADSGRRFALVQVRDQLGTIVGLSGHLASNNGVPASAMKAIAEAIGRPPGGEGFLLLDAPRALGGWRPKTAMPKSAVTTQLVSG